MKAEIIAVGTELLIGQIVNTNAKDISLKFAELGIDVFFHTVVGDNKERLRKAIEIARTRADIIVFSGGIGPTMDDITKDVLADYLNRSLYVDDLSMQKIEALFKDRGTHMVESNIRQAHMLEGADRLENEVGLAVGNGIIQDGTIYIVLPGPPRELIPMLSSSVEPWLREKLVEHKPLYSRILKFAGIGESLLEDKLMQLIKNQTDPTIAPYAKEGEVAIRVSTKAETEDEANAKIDVIVGQIHDIVGDHLYAQEDISIEEEVLHLLHITETKIAVAESCSGGLLASLLTRHPGTSETFNGGVVTYTNDMKTKLLNIPMDQLEGQDAPGAVSEQTAIAMAEQVRLLFNTDFGVSLTGVAGPTESEGKPVGLVYCGVAQKDKPTVCFTLNLKGNRETIQLRAVKQALFRVWQKLRILADDELV